MELSTIDVWIKLGGAAAGSVLSLSVLRPLNTADAFFRFVAGLIGGFICGPLLKNRYYPDVVDAAGVEIMLALTAAAAFVAYFTLSAISGTISKWATVLDIFQTLQEIKNSNDRDS